MEMGAWSWGTRQLSKFMAHMKMLSSAGMAREEHESGLSFHQESILS